MNGSMHTWSLLPFAQYKAPNGFPVAAVNAMSGSEELYNSIIFQGTALNPAQHWVL